MGSTAIAQTGRTGTGDAHWPVSTPRTLGCAAKVAAGSTYNQPAETVGAAASFSTAASL